MDKGAAVLLLLFLICNKGRGAVLLLLFLICDKGGGWGSSPATSLSDLCIYHSVLRPLSQLKGAKLICNTQLLF